MSSADEAVALYCGGQFGPARARALGELPGLLNLAATAAHALGRAAEAEKLCRLALTLQPNFAEALDNLGLLLSQSGQAGPAEAAFRQAAAANPGHAEAHYHLGEWLQRAGRHAEAEQAFRRAIAARPDHAAAWCNLGIALAQSQRPGEAEAAYRQALALQPELVEALINLAALCATAERDAEAEALLGRALALNPGNPAAWNNFGLLRQKHNRPDEAEAAFKQALACGPAYAETHSNLGNLYDKQNRPAEAELCYRQAIAAQPDYPEAHYNLGLALEKLNRHGEAEAAYRQALALKPEFPDAWMNLGNLLNAVRRQAEAEAALRQALAQSPGDLMAQFNLSLVLLAQGRLAEAWPRYETRHSPQLDTRVDAPQLPFPPWQGEPLQGKALLLWPEQGHGDMIQFCRLAPLLQGLGAAKVGLACEPPLTPLLQTLAGVDAIHTLHFGQAIDLSGYDYWLLLLSLPLRLGLELGGIPARLPYLSALPERLAQWRGRLPPGRPRVGLAWKGRANHHNDRHRSLPGLKTLAPLWGVPGIHFVSLQKGAGEDEALNPPAGQPLAALGQDIQDFADTAAIIAQLDLVICVDTSAAHVCGALARPCWVLLPFIGSDWRWLQQREDSPWYPGALRLFRQGPDEAWDAVAGRVALALRQWQEDQAAPGGSPS